MKGRERGWIPPNKHHHVRAGNEQLPLNSWVGDHHTNGGKGVLGGLLRQSLDVMRNQLITVIEGTVTWFIKPHKEKYVKIQQCLDF